MSDAPSLATGPWRQRPGLSVTLVDDDAFIVDPATDDIFHLNVLGRALRKILAQPQTLAKLVTAVADAFPDIPRLTITADTEAFMATMVQRGLIETVD
jgi:hypothetical protein